MDGIVVCWKMDAAGIVVCFKMDAAGIVVCFKMNAAGIGGVKGCASKLRSEREVRRPTGRSHAIGKSDVVCPARNWRERVK